MKYYKFVRVNNKSCMTEILREYNECFLESIESRVGDLAEYADKLLSYAQTYMIIYENTVAGIVVFYANDQNKKEAYLTMIAVSKHFRGNGLASLLLKQCEDKSKEAGMKQLSLEVDVRNENAIGFYLKKGFKYLGKATENSIYLTKELE